MNVKKYKLRYDYLKLELEDTEKDLQAYTEKWNEKFSKYFNNLKNEQTVWVNEETGEVRNSPPEEETVEIRKKKVDKYKKVFRKLSMKLHPDHGGKDEDFLRAKKAYDEDNVFELLTLAVDYEVAFEVDEEDAEYLEKTCLELENKIIELKQTLPYLYLTGNLKAKMAVINKVEQMIGYKIKLEEITDLL